MWTRADRACKRNHYSCLFFRANWIMQRIKCIQKTKDFLRFCNGLWMSGAHKLKLRHPTHQILYRVWPKHLWGKIRTLIYKNNIWIKWNEGDNCYMFAATLKHHLNPGQGSGKQPSPRNSLRANGKRCCEATWPFSLRTQCNLWQHSYVMQNGTRDIRVVIIRINIYVNLVAKQRQKNRSSTNCMSRK